MHHRINGSRRLAADLSIYGVALFRMDAMSLHVLATGVLISNPQKRSAKNGSEYFTGQLRVQTDDGTILIGFIAFGSEAIAALATLGVGDACAITGHANLTQWTAKNSTKAHGLSIVAERVMTIDT
jgi:Single-strand binding protein family